MLRGAPVTLGFVVVFWILGILTSSIVAGPGAMWRAEVAATAHSLPDHWWAVLASAFWARDPLGYVLETVLVLIAGIPLERQMGSLKFSLATVVAQIAGILAATGFWEAARSLMGTWALEMNGTYFLGPSALVCGAAMAATAAMGTLWRRRVRLGIFGLLILLALYSGGFADLVRLGAGGAGALLGPVLLGHRPRLARPVSSRHEGRVLVALLVAVSAVGPVVAGLIPHAVGPLSVLRFLFTDIEPVDPQTLQAVCAVPAQHRDCEAAHLQLRAGAGGIFMAIVPSFLLLLLSEGLRRGRRFAWVGALLVQAALSVLALITVVGVLQAAGPDTVAGELVNASQSGGRTHPLTLVVPLLVPVALFGVLLACQRLFPVAAPRGTYTPLAARVLGLAGILGLVYVGVGLALAPGFTPVPALADLAADVPDRFLPLGFTVDVPPAFFPQTTPTVLLYEGVGIVFWAVTGVLGLKTFLRPAHPRHGTDKDRAREILAAGEGSSISWMTTWPGNTYWFSGAGDSFIAYRVIAGIALTLGAPVGPKTGTSAVVEEFAGYCRSNGWTACLYSVPAEVRDAASHLGWDSVQVAQETVLPLDSLSFRGKQFQDIRTAMNNAMRAGIHAEWIRYPTAHLAVQAQIQAISEEWVAERKMQEMGFTLGGLEELDDPEVRCLLAVDASHRVHAVTSWLPVYRDGHIIGWTLDFMRSRSTGFRAAIEFLIASAAISLKDEGFHFVSLSGAPLAHAPGGRQLQLVGAGPEESGRLGRLLDRLGSALEPVYGFRSLLAFKGKFRPRYAPLYMVYPDSAALPAIANALSRAYLPDLSLGERLQLLRKVLRRKPTAPARSGGQGSVSRR
ncbi:bifunctional lysylphosphatidylglycerol flippase/synthetase MprF [Pseudarthrobacter albicanus]|uniref:bifunctional lysylphosphatidylglycerol flippase/synthetase MprF n=1 Tax=Pseudarthrobacter albicanus TaxID=2823873 RepID=UPI0027DB9CB7|nr:rhomboid family intramembrane serine protease [Pseudarthrobacter albicanus]